MVGDSHDSPTTPDMTRASKKIRAGRQEITLDIDSCDTSTTKKLRMTAPEANVFLLLLTDTLLVSVSDSKTSGRALCMPPRMQVRVSLDGRSNVQAALAHRTGRLPTGPPHLNEGFARPPQQVPHDPGVHGSFGLLVVHISSSAHRLLPQPGSLRAATAKRLSSTAAVAKEQR